MVQCVAVCCSVLQCVAVCRGVLQCVCESIPRINLSGILNCHNTQEFVLSCFTSRLWCNTLQCTPQRTMHQTATRCNTLQHAATQYIMTRIAIVAIMTLVLFVLFKSRLRTRTTTTTGSCCSSVLQCAAECCSVL